MDFGRGVDESIGTIGCSRCGVEEDLGKDAETGLVIMAEFQAKHRHGQSAHQAVLESRT